jgi:hypothetical protein
MATFTPPVKVPTHSAPDASSCTAHTDALLSDAGFIGSARKWRMAPLARSR